MSLTTRARRGLVGSLAGALTAAGLLAVASPSHAADTAVSGVQFRWGVSNEANNRGAAPGTFNLFSAGKLGNPGAGNQSLNNANSGATWSPSGTAAGWATQSGNVFIEKKTAAGLAPATWAGTKTDRDGASLGNYATGTKFSDHEVVIDNGTGTIDAAADDANITWDGDFTVVLYSGLTYFYVSDPQLTVVNGVGTLTATVGGYGANQQDPDQWDPLPDTQVTLANIPAVDVTADGFVGTPEYAGVTYTGNSSTVPQSTTSAFFGSFPQSFVDFQQLTGAGPYWYSTGGGIDKNKAALPITVDVTPGAHPVAPVVTVASSVSVTGSSVTYGRGGTVAVTVSAPGAAANGTVTLTGVGATQTAALVSGSATFAVPSSLGVGTHVATATYSGTTGVNGAAGQGTVSVAKASTVKPTVKVSKKPTSKKAGRATLKVTSSVSGLKPAGKVKITLTKGKSVKRITVTVKNGTATVKLPKLKKGTWKLKASYAGSATQSPATSKTYKVRSSR